MSDPREVVRVGKFLIAHDPNFLQPNEYDLFSVEVEDGREALSWVMSVTIEESKELISVLRMISDGP